MRAGQSPPSNSSNYCKTTVGDEVEVYSTSCDGEPFGWWLAKIRMIVGEYTAFVLPSAIRFCNQNKCGAIEGLVRSYKPEPQKLSMQETEQCHTVANEFTEELWESEEGRPDWHLPLAPPPPKAKKCARRRRKRQEAKHTIHDGRRA